MDKLQQLLAQAREERYNADLIVKWLEQKLTQMNEPFVADLKPESESKIESSRPKTTPKASKKRRTIGRRTGASVPVLAETILRAFPKGLMTTPLLAELRKLGYESRSKNPANTLNSILRQAGDPFRRLSDGRWILKEFADHQQSDSPNDTQETPIH
jgi:hypothetical protein